MVVRLGSGSDFCCFGRRLMLRCLGLGVDDVCKLGPTLRCGCYDWAR